ncbi:MAG: YkgJ family cysteine cluster protein [Acidobacteriota bacterium]
MDDAGLVRIVDAAMAEAARKAGAWLVCRPGCNACCIGPFEITALDAGRLRRGLAELDAANPERAERVRQRAEARLAKFEDDDPCPALDPASGLCDLYAARPITCRTFGPPVHCDSGGVGVCELCFEGATDDEIAACEVEVDPEGLEARLNEALGGAGVASVAAALAGPWPTTKRSDC